MLNSVNGNNFGTFKKLKKMILKLMIVFGI